MECIFCGSKAEWQGERSETTMQVCQDHFHAYYTSFWMWRKING